MKIPSLLVFDLEITGHHAEYIQYLVNYWYENNIDGMLLVLVSPDFLKRHSDIVTISLKYDTSNIQFLAITSDEFESLTDVIASNNSFVSRTRRAFQEWKLLRKYLTRFRIEHCLIMYLDKFFLLLALNVGLPCKFSCIYFRPIFHYGEFQHYTSSVRERSWFLRDKFCLSRLLSNSNFRNLFCLDPLAIDPIKRLMQNLGNTNNAAKIIFSPDPVQIHSNSRFNEEKLRESLQIQPGRVTFLLFGSISYRKGVLQLLDAISKLTSEFSQKICLLIVGPVTEIGVMEKIEFNIENLGRTSMAQVIRLDKFISDQEVQSYFNVSDVILAPYQRHIGMSGILVRASAAGKPVLSSDFGLMGEITRRHKLGLTVNSESPDAISKGIKKFLIEEPASLFCAEKARNFAQKNGTKEFSETIFQNISKSCAL